MSNGLFALSSNTSLEALLLREKQMAEAGDYIAVGVNEILQGIPNEVNDLNAALRTIRSGAQKFAVELTQYPLQKQIIEDVIVNLEAQATAKAFETMKAAYPAAIASIESEEQKTNLREKGKNWRFHNSYAQTLKELRRIFTMLPNTRRRG